MDWDLSFSPSRAEYVYEEEGFYTDDIRQDGDPKFHKEPSSGYKEPDDDVMVCNFIATSQHGDFKWIVTARREGFNSYASIDDPDSHCPEGCDIVSDVQFDIS